jgi:ABC-type multidrug transport system permease subunit
MNLWVLLAIVAGALTAYIGMLISALRGIEFEVENMELQFVSPYLVQGSVVVLLNSIFPVPVLVNWMRIKVVYDGHHLADLRRDETVLIRQGAPTSFTLSFEFDPKDAGKTIRNSSLKRFLESGGSLLGMLQSVKESEVAFEVNLRANYIVDRRFSVTKKLSELG